MNIIVMGKPGSGKGVQASLIAKKHNLEHISPGELFRQQIKNNTKLGKKVKSYIESGKLVPDEVTDEITHRALEKIDYENFVLDGYPRTIPQAINLNQKLKGKSLKVILLEVSNKTAIQRMQFRHKKEFRPEGDDKKKLAERIEAYNKLTKPILEDYKRRGVLQKVDGEKTIEEIEKKIEKLISH